MKDVSYVHKMRNLTLKYVNEEWRNGITLYRLTDKNGNYYEWRTRKDLEADNTKWIEVRTRVKYLRIDEESGRRIYYLSHVKVLGEVKDE